QIRDLAKRLTMEFGRGYSQDNLFWFRRFYGDYPDLLSGPKFDAVRQISQPSEIVDATRQISGASEISEALRRKSRSPVPVKGFPADHAVPGPAQIHPWPSPAAKDFCQPL